MIMLYPKRKQLLLIAFVILVIIYFTLYFANYNSFLNFGDSDSKLSGLYFFYNLHIGIDFGYFHLFVLLSLPLISSINVFESRVMKSDLFEISRIGYKKYFIYALFNCTKDIWFFPISINLLFVLLLYLTGFNVFNGNYINLYTSSNILDFVIFNLIQSLGWILLNVLAISFSQLFNNKYVFGLSVFIFSISITLISVFIFLPFEFISVEGIGSLYVVIVYVLSPFTLVSAGLFDLIGTSNNLLLLSIFSILFYLILNITLLRFIVFRRKKYNYVF